MKLGDIDEITLDITGTVIERLDAPTDEAPGAVSADRLTPLDDGADDDDEVAAGPITIAVDMSDPQPAPSDSPST